MVYEEVKTAGSWGDVYPDYVPEVDAPLGTYTAHFSGADGSVEQPFDVVRPDGPRLYEHDERIVLFQFQPNETIRLYAYEIASLSDSSLTLSFLYTLYALSFWNEFVTDAEGQLIIEGFSGSKFAVVGETSGRDFPALRKRRNIHRATRCSMANCTSATAIRIFPRSVKAS